MYYVRKEEYRDSYEWEDHKSTWCQKKPKAYQSENTQKPNIREVQLPLCPTGVTNTRWNQHKPAHSQVQLNHHWIPQRLPYNYNSCDYVTHRTNTVIIVTRSRQHDQNHNSSALEEGD